MSSNIILVILFIVKIEAWYNQASKFVFATCSEFDQQIIKLNASIMQQASSSFPIKQTENDRTRDIDAFQSQNYTLRLWLIYAD